MANAGETTIRHLLDPFTHQRRDLVFQNSAGGPASSSPNREIDGSEWWILPAALDGDAHMPFVPAGLRSYDLLAALHGGVNHMVVALPYQLARQQDLATLVSDMTRPVLPAITPVLSVSPDEASVDFPAWLTRNLETIRQLLPGVIKLYTGDPNFRANLDAVRSAGLKPAVFAFTPSEFESLMQAETGPLHVRHVTSKAMLDAVRSIKGATCQTSPHMVLALANGRRKALAVMPTPPPDSDRESLIGSLGDVNMIASDHVSPPVAAPTGPGLQTQQHFVPALLTMSETHDLDLPTLWQSVTSGPAKVFGLEVEPGSIVVEPTAQQVVGLWPRQRDDRAPYLGRSLRGRVLAVTRGGHGVMV